MVFVTILRWKGQGNLPQFLGNGDYLSAQEHYKRLTREAGIGEQELHNQINSPDDFLYYEGADREIWLAGLDAAGPNPLSQGNSNE